MSDNRPIWAHKIPIDVFEELYEFSIVGARHRWKFTSEDTSVHWVELQCSVGEGEIKEIREPTGFAECFKYDPNYRELFQLTYNGERAVEDLKAIRKWEKKNARELAEYKRLKEKFR